MGGLILSQREQGRLMMLNQVLMGGVGVGEAAGVLGLSERHVWRLLAAYRKEGAVALCHGNRGRRPAHAIPEAVRQRVVDLAQRRYPGVNHSHLTQLLAEREGLILSRSTVRRILVVCGIKSPRHRRQPKHRCRRERLPMEGMMLQIDGSRHDWLEGRGPYLSLIAAMDDATGKVPYAIFRIQEDAHGYFLLLQEVIRKRGIPLALYSDRHGIFQRSARETECLEEQLSGQRQLTQFGRALRELGIEAIFALSPQAKGRIERLFGTLQDRLVSELRLAGASTVEEANQVLQTFLPDFNLHFAVPAAQEGSAYRHPDPGLRLEEVLCFKYQRTVAADNTIRFEGQTLQLLPGLERRSYAHARVEVQERLDGSLVVSYEEQAIATRQAPPHPVTLRARKADRRTCTGHSKDPLPQAEHVIQSSELKDVVAVPSSPASHHTHRWKPPSNHPRRKSWRLTKSLNT